MKEKKDLADQAGASPEAEFVSGSDSMVNPISSPIERDLTESGLRWDWEWWRCYRKGPVSGRYEGKMTEPKAGGFELDLRVDIDPRYANSPVMDKVSGDFYQVYEFNIWGRKYRWRIYRESWIVDNPEAKWSSCKVVITGKVRYWEGTHPTTSLIIEIPWGSFTPAGPAKVIFYETGGGKSFYTCNRKSHCFRDVTLEVDVVQSVNSPPILPSYNTHSHNNRPPDLPERVLTIQEGYREAGICLDIRADRTIIDDSDSQFDTWSVGELHDAMETYFSQFSGTWPKWQLWGILAGSYVNSGTGGIMFDYWGAYEPPERQGFAVFRNHSWFNDLPSGNPTTQAEAAALRQLLYVWVHEAGHAFNFMHSWDKGRPDSLSWMNYDWRYDDRNGDGSYWSAFEFRFDDEELIHMRHGNRSSVIMGGDPWSSGGHAESPPGAMSLLEGEAPIEVLVRSQQYFEFMEPVAIEIRLRNLMDDLPIPVDTHLNPEFGALAVYIQRPDGRIFKYEPILCQLATPETRILQPANKKSAGEDRYSEEIYVASGRSGFYFDTPGEYLIRAFYQGSGDILIPSAPHRIYIGTPQSKDEERLAQDFFSRDTGLGLYMGGSHSEFLSKAMDVLYSIGERYKGSPSGIKISAALAKHLSRSFFRLEKGKMKQIKKADPEKALELTSPAVSIYQKQKEKAWNLQYHQIVRTRADLMQKIGKAKEAKDEVSRLRKDLSQRGVKKFVLDMIKDFEGRLK